MSNQDRLHNNGPEATRLTKPDDGNDRMQNKRESVAHAPDRIKLRSSRIQAASGIRLPHRVFQSRADGGFHHRTVFADQLGHGVGVHLDVYRLAATYSNRLVFPVRLGFSRVNNRFHANV